jgi:hypothetical protein
LRQFLFCRRLGTRLHTDMIARLRVDGIVRPTNQLRLHRDRPLGVHA